VDMFYPVICLIVIKGIVEPWCRVCAVLSAFLVTNGMIVQHSLISEVIV